MLKIKLQDKTQNLLHTEDNVSLIIIQLKRKNN